MRDEESESFDDHMIFNLFTKAFEKFYTTRTMRYYTYKIKLFVGLSNMFLGKEEILNDMINFE